MFSNILPNSKVVKIIFFNNFILNDFTFILCYSLLLLKEMNSSYTTVCQNKIVFVVLQSNIAYKMFKLVRTFVSFSVSFISFENISPGLK